MSIVENVFELMCIIARRGENRYLYFCAVVILQRREYTPPVSNKHLAMIRRDLDYYIVLESKGSLVSFLILHLHLTTLAIDHMTRINGM